MFCFVFWVFFFFTVSNGDFVIKIQEIQVEESEDAHFECVLTHPLPRISWMGKGNILEEGEKYHITVSDHKLIHRLVIKDCTQQDKGIYSAVAGITSCSAWLVVEGNTLQDSVCWCNPNDFNNWDFPQINVRHVFYFMACKS